MIEASLLLSLAAALVSAPSGEWPQWGRDQSKNMASPETNLPATFDLGDFDWSSEDIGLEGTTNIQWIAKLGSQSYGNATVSGGRIYVGTNNDSPRDPRYKGDRSVLYCLDQASGELIWQLNVPKLGTGKVSDWEFLGICSSPSVDGDRVYLLSNRCEVLCLDVNGLADGNQGYQDEGLYLAWPSTTPMELADTDADILWMLNMIDECGVFPHNITSSAILVTGEHLWVSTSNGVDYGHVETPAPFAPSLILVDKETGELLAEEASGLSQRIFHCNWSSPAYLKTDEHEYCIFGGPDGRVYAFRPEPVEDEDGYKILSEAWRFDANKPEYRMKDGVPLKYATREGPSEVLASPVVWGGRVYVAIGQDPEHGEGLGNLVCIDPGGEGDVTETHQVWSYGKINRSLSTLAISDDGLVFAADFSGFVYCLDALTGEEYWVHDTLAHIWASPLVADGRVYIGNEDGIMTVLPATRELDEDAILEIDMYSPIYASAVAADETLYVASHTHLFALKKAAE